MTARWLSTAVGVCMALTAIAQPASAQTAAPTDARRFPMGKAGTMVLQAPREWVEKTTPAAEGLSTIHFGTRAEPHFILTIETIAFTNERLPAATLRRETELVLNSVRAQAVEIDIPLREFETRLGPGFYFAVTDIAPKPGGFKLMDRGLVQLDGVLLQFTLLMNESGGGIRAAALATLASATFTASQAKD